MGTIRDVAGQPATITSVFIQYQLTRRSIIIVSISIVYVFCDWLKGKSGLLVIATPLVLWVQSVHQDIAGHWPQNSPKYIESLKYRCCVDIKSSKCFHKMSYVHIIVTAEKGTYMYVFTQWFTVKTITLIGPLAVFEQPFSIIIMALKNKWNSCRICWRHTCVKHIKENPTT
jgi:hypothetical protein